MKISKNKVISLSYELEVEGKIADKAGKEQPLEYIHGTHMLLPRFEEELEGKEPGDGFEFVLSPEEGYGKRRADYIFDLPKSAFAMNGAVQEQLLVPGNMIPMLDAGGNVIRGIVLEVAEDKVKMDFNHPMADKTLHFKGEIISVRDASEEEIKFGLHGEYKPSEGSCNCSGGCGGDSCDCSGGSCEGGSCDCSGGSCKCN